jgi:hypothetical protein
VEASGPIYLQGREKGGTYIHGIKSTEKAINDSS